MSKARDLANAGTALTSVSPTELGYLDGVTSAVQTQINAKLATTTAASTYEAALPSQTGNSGKYLTTDGSAKSWGTLTIPSAPSLNEQIFTSSGSWTAPTGVTKVWVDVVGGGGTGGRGAGFGAAGGGAGGRVQKQVTVTPSSSYTITIGAGGGQITGGYNGSAGSASSFDSTSASGGPAGFGGTGGMTGLGSDDVGGSQVGVASRTADSPANSGAGGTATYSVGYGGGSGLVTVRWIA